MGAADHTAVSEREQRILGIIETARAKRAALQGRADHDGARRRRQGDPDADRGPAGCRRSASQALDALGDAGVVSVGGTDVALTTDSFVVKPIRFPGGSIGELAVNGTVNDLAMAGARPLALSLSLMLEEGLPADELRAEVEAIAAAAEAAGVEIVAGDTKVVERGHADAHVRVHDRDRRARPARAPVAGRSAAGRPRCSCPARSASTARRSCWPAATSSSRPTSSRDTRSLWPAVDALLEAAGPALHCMRDATRGGVASVLNELARASRRGDDRRARPTCRSTPAVAGAAELLGIDPDVRRQRGQAGRLRGAGGGRRRARRAAAVPGCERAAEIGEVKTEPPGMVLVETAFGGKRVMDQLVGDPLPRIC